MPNSHNVPQESFAPFFATLAAVRAEREASDRLMDALVIATAREVVAERVAQLKAREFFEAGGAR